MKAINKKQSFYTHIWCCIVIIAWQLDLSICTSSMNKRNFTQMIKSIELTFPRTLTQIPNRKLADPDLKMQITMSSSLLTRNLNNLVLRRTMPKLMTRMSGVSINALKIRLTGVGNRWISNFRLSKFSLKACNFYTWTGMKHERNQQLTRSVRL